MKLKIGMSGWKIASVGFIVILAITMLKKFSIVDFSNMTSDLLVIFAALFVVVEIVKEKSGRKLNTFELAGLILATVVFITAVLGIVGVPLVFFDPYEGIAIGIMLLYMLIEIFKK